MWVWVGGAVRPRERGPRAVVWVCSALNRKTGYGWPGDPLRVRVEILRLFRLCVSCVAVCLQVQAERTRRSHRYRCTAPPEPVARASSIPQNLRLRRTHPRAPCRTAGQSVSRRPAASRQARASLSRRCQRAQRDLPREGTRTWPSAERRARRTRGRSALAPPSTSGRVLTTLSLARRRAALSKARPGLAGQRGPSG